MFIERLKNPKAGEFLSKDIGSARTLSRRYPFGDHAPR